MSQCTAAAVGGGDPTPVALLLQAASLVPASHYLLAAAFLVLVFLYNFLEFHALGDALRGFRGDPVTLTFDPASEIYRGVVSKCRILHGRYLATPWLASPHFQTAFLNFFGNPPVVSYRRQLFSLHDEGTIALDWLLASDGGSSEIVGAISKEDPTPIVVIVPGLTSDSFSPYMKHLVHGVAQRGWNVVVSNHRGLGGISMTSDCFYNAGWTEDLREIVNYLHQEYPKAPLFAIGTSIGANVLVKYLGEEGENTPIAGAAAVCSPWDLVVVDRFINRKLVQRLYDRALAIGLKDYAQLHQPILTRVANWDGIEKSCSVRDFDHHATRLIGKFETVDTFYRHCSSTSYVGGVSIPLLCVSALDDPLCTREAIPWDECRINKNIVLATTTHGGHLAFFEGITARSLWWVGAVNEFLGVLRSSPYMHSPKKVATPLHSSLESCIDKSPYVNITEDGMVAAMIKDGVSNRTGSFSDGQRNQTPATENTAAVSDPSEHQTEVAADSIEHQTEVAADSIEEPTESSRLKAQDDMYTNILRDIAVPIKKSINKISRRSRTSMWLLTYIAIVTSWPVVGSILLIVFRKKLSTVLPAAWLRR